MDLGAKVKLNSKIHELENINIASHQLVENKEMNILNLKNKNKNLENKLNLKEREFIDLKDNHLVEKTSVETEKQKKKIEKEFYQLAKKEIYTNYKNNMDEMIETTLDLEKKYNSAVEKAFVLGVDLKDSNIDGLVKGRKFELFSATIWNNDKRTLIEDWTLDKGFNEKIYIKSNGNPDFSILQNDSYKRVAIECKYRSKFNNKVFTNLGNEKSIKRYNVFQREKNIDVFILLGIEGSSDNPNCLYLIPLKNIEEVRVVDKFYDNFNTTSNKLRKFKVNKNNLIDKMFS